MKNFKKIICSFIVISTLILVFTLSSFFRGTENSEAAIISVKTLTWNLVDSGKNLDWGGNSAYLSSFTSGVSTWNAYKPGVIRKDTLSTIEDVTISDYTEVSNTAGVASPSGTIRFNTHIMKNLDPTQKLNVATHELGHVLGLAHNVATDVMYEYVSNNVNLSINDKASYDAAYSKY
ncbi:matrixin family metalloprotease [Metasolibacillus meyeri]|uniref:Matrixin family metalloprotease n=1 Tax=Metasolibacillus meyeri TaxID=1071052 RepID=A0AAW9NR97_9BACL|nr:matrixin family metalloprotease [Metasolibacillus meyeri]MEC1178259.1 matrixin family metalloprotease [Metasolibacillus meyeri]